jgi:hypothetical protein
MSLIKKYLHNIDLVRNKLMNPLLNPLTTSQRTTIGGTLGTSDQGYIAFDITENLLYFWDGSSWQTTGGGSFGRGEWGFISGTLSAQTDLINYLSSTYVPLNRNITINGITYDLSADRTWTISAGSVAWGSIVGTLTAQTDLTTYLAANYYPLSSNPANYLDQIAADLLYYPLSSNPAGYLTSGSGGGLYLKLDQTTPQTVINGVPSFSGGIIGYIKDTGGTLAVDNINRRLTDSTGFGVKFDWELMKFPSFTSNGFVKTSGGDGTLTIDTNTYLTSAVTSVGAISPITSSGGNTPTISTSMATNKLIGRSSAGTGVMEEISVGTGLSLSGGTLSSSAVGGILHGTASGTDTYVVSITGPTAYADGDSYLIRFTNGNTTGATLNINGIGAIPLYRNNDGALIGGDIEDGAEMLCVYNSTLTVFQCIGTSPNTILAYVTNAEASSITKGQAVYAFGGTGDRMTVKLAYNTADATSAQTVGLVWSASIGANQKGFIMLQGLLDGLSILPTATYTDGDAIYLGATAGSITNVKPYAPNHLVYLGVVTTASNGSAGRMYVKVQNGYELDELHNVQAQSPTVNDVLYYFGGSPGQWKTASISTVLGYTPVNSTRTISTTAPLAGGGDLSADRTLSITQAATGTNGYLSSTDWNTFNNKISDDPTVLGYQGLGSVIKGFPLGINLTAAGTTTAMTDARLWLVPVYLPVSQTLTGVKWYQATTGNYTADNYNGIGLYTVSAGVATLVASSTDDGNIWKGSVLWQSKAFSSPYAATKGTYYIGALYNSSAQTTAPGAIGVSITTAAIQTFDFTSGRMYCYLAAQSSLPASITLSTAVSLGSSGLYFSLY